MQCVRTHCGHFCFTSACIFWNLLVFVLASVYIPRQFFYSIFASFINLHKIAHNASAVALSSIGLQRRGSSAADIPLQNGTSAIK